ALYVEEVVCMAHRNFRLPDPLANRIVQVAEKQGYASTSAFIRAAIEEKLDSRRENGSEERIVATLERLGQELRRLGTALQAEFALVDALARVVLLCVPEPPAEVHAQALASAKERHQKLLKMAAVNMQGEARATVTRLVGHAE